MYRWRLEACTKLASQAEAELRQSEEQVFGWHKLSLTYR